ncbi:hypothetical protein ACLOJK_036829 [Asimina triloba]
MRNYSFPAKDFLGAVPGDELESSVDVYDRVVGLQCVGDNKAARRRLQQTPDGESERPAVVEKESLFGATGLRIAVPVHDDSSRSSSFNPSKPELQRKQKREKPTQLKTKNEEFDGKEEDEMGRNGNKREKRNGERFYLGLVRRRNENGGEWVEVEG